MTSVQPPKAPNAARRQINVIKATRPVSRPVSRPATNPRTHSFILEQQKKAADRLKEIRSRLSRPSTAASRPASRPVSRPVSRPSSRPITPAPAHPALRWLRGRLPTEPSAPTETKTTSESTTSSESPTTPSVPTRLPIRRPARKAVANNADKLRAIREAKGLSRNLRRNPRQATGVSDLVFLNSVIRRAECRKTCSDGLLGKLKVIYGEIDDAHNNKAPAAPVVPADPNAPAAPAVSDAPPSE